MNSELLSLPVTRSDRTGSIFWDRASYSFVYPQKTLETTSKDFDAQGLLAFSCLVVFSRLFQLSSLCIKSGEVDVGLTLTPDETLSQALLNLTTNAPTDMGCNRVKLEIIPHAPPSGFGSGNNDETLFLYFEQLTQDLRLTLLFNNNFYTKISAQDLLEKLSNVIHGLAYSPECLISEVDLITEVAREIIPNPAREISRNRFEFVPTTFLKVSERFSDQPAIENGSDSYSYAELRAAALHLASRLAIAGVDIGDIVTVSGRSSFGLIASSIAIMLAGGVLVTIDENLPLGRQKQIADLTNAKYKIQVTSGEYTDNSLSDCIVTRDWPERDELEALGKTACPAVAIPDDASAYLFFTSGSTGVPKGVLGTHLGLGHFLDWQRSHFPIGPGDRSAQVTALSFDVVLRDIFYPLTSGATIYIPSRDIIFDARKMLAWISNYRISVLHSVPSLMKAWLQAETGNRSFRSLKYIFFAGEPLTDVLLTRFKNSADQQTKIINLYGPTETTLAKLANPVDDIEVGVQPIGRPQPGVDVFIMRDRKMICGLGEIGEIAIRTPYRSKGYFMNESLTGQVFVKNPFRDDSSDLLYFTGDLGRYRADGKIEIFGRIDAQIKIRGVRIEPNEIEAQITQYPGINDAAVTSRVGPNGDKALFAFVVPNPQCQPTEAQELSQKLREFLRTKLHEAMVPTRLIPLDSLPYLPNGKLDRKALANLDVDFDTMEPSSPDVANIDGKTQEIVKALEAILATRIRNLDSSFVDLGGDSLSFIEFSLIIEKHLGWLPDKWENIPLGDLVAMKGDDETRPTRMPGKNLFCSINLSVFFRAVGILIVVIDHAGYLNESATTVLFVIAGMSFGRFMFPNIIQTGRIEPVFRYVLKFAVPASLWRLLAELTRPHFWLPDIFLMGTFWQNPAGGHFNFWFLDVLSATIVMISLFAIMSRSIRRRRPKFITEWPSFFWEFFILTMFGVLIWFAQVYSGWWDGTVGSTSVAPFKWLWMLWFGASIALATTTWQKAALTCFIALLGWLYFGHIVVAPHFTHFFGNFFFISVPALIWFQNIPIPKHLRGIIVKTASTSLFIYIVNWTVITTIMPKLHIPPLFVLQIALPVLTGIVAAYVWENLVRIVFRSLKRSREQIVDEVVDEA